MGLRRDEFKVKKPYANLIAEAIENGYAIITSPGHARILGRIARGTNESIIISKPCEKTYPQYRNILTPRDVRLIEEFKNHMIFGRKKNGTI